MATQEATIAVAEVKTEVRLRAHLSIMRIDHWVKNVFVLPGIVVACGMDRHLFGSINWGRLVVGLFAVCLIASSNYVINEILDAPFDVNHPTKRFRPVPCGKVSIPAAYFQWLALMLVGLWIGYQISHPLAVVLGGLWIMGCVYNIPPIRSKDLPYADVLSEAVNNPLRMLAGWYLAGTSAVPPASLLVSYWMVGCYFMAIKRFAEYRGIADVAVSAAYRKSFAFYNERRLLVSVMFYASHAMLFFGAFLMRYRMELILAFPLVAVVMACYLSIAFKRDGAAEKPERLYREPALMAAVLSCTVIMAMLLFVDIPGLHKLFAPSVFQ